MFKLDKQGNKINIDKKGDITLHLIKEHPRIRKIGNISEDIYTKFDEEKHIFRKLNAWSINYEIFKISNKINISTKDSIYKIKTKDIDPTILHFKKSGIEKKVYIPLKYWKKYKK